MMRPDLARCAWNPRAEWGLCNTITQLYCSIIHGKRRKLKQTNKKSKFNSRPDTCCSTNSSAKSRVAYVVENVVH